MKVAIDLDGVVFDWVNCAIASLKILGRVGPRFEEIGVTKYGMLDVTEEEVKDFCVRALPYKGAIADLNGIAGAHEVHIISGRCPSIMDHTRSWLKEHCPRIKNVHFLGRRGAKWEVCKQLGMRLLLDDDELEFFNAHKNGIDCVLMNRPWNRSVEKAIRVNSINSFMTVCNNAENYFAVRDML